MSNNHNNHNNYNNYNLQLFTRKQDILPSPKSAAVRSLIEEVYAMSMFLGNHVAVQHAHMCCYVVNTVVILSFEGASCFWFGTAVCFFSSSLSF